MKKLIIMLAAVMALTVTSCDTKKEKQEQTNTADATIDSLKRVIAQTQNESNDLMGTIEQIQEGFRQINEAEGRISSENSQGEGSDRQAILENMAFIQSRMQQNRELIANLREQLRASSRNNTQMKGTLEEMVANFEKQLNDRYEELFRIFYKHRDQIDRVTFWGLTDDRSWKNNYPVPRRTNYPQLFNRDYSAKDGLYAVLRIPDEG